MKRALWIGMLAVSIAGCGGKDETAATVAGTKISTHRVERVLEHAREEFEREGKRFPAEGTAEYRQLANQALALLVYREELEQSARRLGIAVDDEEVAQRLRTRESQQGEEEEREGAEDEELRADAIRSSLLYRRIYERITRGLRVSPAQVARYYRRYRDLFASQGRTFADARAEIEHDLLAAAANARMARWVEAMRRSFASKIVYGEGFSPPE